MTIIETYANITTGWHVYLNEFTNVLDGKKAKPVKQWWISRWSPDGTHRIQDPTETTRKEARQIIKTEKLTKYPPLKEEEAAEA